MIYIFTNHTYGAPFQRAVRHMPRRSRSDLTLVFTAPAQPSGRRARGKARLRAHFRELHLAALGLASIKVKDVNDPAFVAAILPNDHAVVAGFNQIFGRKAIDAFGSIVNFHPSVLPLYRGPVPSFWCLQNAETQSGFTLHRVTTSIDAGEVLHQEIVQVASNDTPVDLDRRIARAAVHTFRRWIRHLELNEPWNPSTIDGYRVYRVHVGYQSFPPSG